MNEEEVTEMQILFSFDDELVRIFYVPKIQHTDEQDFNFLFPTNEEVVSQFSHAKKHKSFHIKTMKNKETPKIIGCPKLL